MQLASQLLTDESFVALGRRILAGRCSLFLGAGASLSSGAPKSEELADLIATNVLMTSAGIPLGQVVEYADGSVGRPAVNDAIKSRLLALEPSASMRSLATVPWRSMYSVNFDDLLEKAYELEQSGVVQVVVTTEGLDFLDERRTPLFMLHGSIKLVEATGKRHRLVLTPDDFAKAAFDIRAFLHRLVDDINGGEVVYIGFGLADQDFRSVITSVHDAVDNQQDLIPRGYAVIPDPPGFARNFWDTKKIHLVDTTLEEFVSALTTLRKGTSGVQAIPVGGSPLLPKFLSAVNPAADLATDIVRAFDFPELDDGIADPALFFKGGPPEWPIVRENYDARRQVTDDLVESALISATDEPTPASPRSTRFILVTGHAGAGKSTILRRAAWDLANTWSRPVVWCRHPSRLQLDLVESLCAQAGQRLYVFVDDAADGALQLLDVIVRAKRRRLTVSFVVGERLNEWISATRMAPMDADAQFELTALTEAEADGVISQLDRAGELGSLKGLGRPEQIERLLTRASGQLLVALREATSEGKRFDEILEDEYRQIPVESARRAYLNVCTLFQFGVPLRAGTLSRTTGVRFEEFAEQILRPANRIILERQPSQREQPVFAARHRVIAEVTFRRALDSSYTRANQIINILRQLDPGYRDDEFAFTRLVNARWLRENSIVGDDVTRIFSEARRLRPSDPFVLQQEALTTRFADPSQSARLLREAEALAPGNSVIRHSQAVLKFDEAKQATEDSDRRKLLAEAEADFKLLRKRNPANSAPYVSLAEIQLYRATLPGDAAEQLRLLASAQGWVDDGLSRCAPSSHLLDVAGRIDESIGEFGAAEDDFRRAAEVAGGDPHVAATYARFLRKHRGPAAAAQALNEALNSNPTHPMLNHELARCLEEVSPVPDAAVRRAYEYALSEPLRGHLPELDYAIYLYRVGDTLSDEHFENLRRLDLPFSVKQRPRAWITVDGKRKVFSAEVAEVGLRTAFVYVEGLETRVFIQPAQLPAGARRGTRLRVNICFNVMGLRAHPAE